MLEVIWLLDAVDLVDVVNEVVPMVSKVLPKVPMNNNLFNICGADDDVDDLVQLPTLVDDEELLLNNSPELLLDDDALDAQGSCELVIEEVITTSWRASSSPCWTSE